MHNLCDDCRQVQVGLGLVAGLVLGWYLYGSTSRILDSNAKPSIDMGGGGEG